MTSETPVADAAAPDAPPALDGISGEEIEAMVRAAEETETSRAGGVRTGRIFEVVGEDVYVELEDGTRGTVHRNEFTDAEPPVAGNEIHVLIEQHDTGGGFVVCSKRKADRELAWQRVLAGEIVTGLVTAMNKGGLEVNIDGLRAFMPASQCDVHRMKDISVLLNEVVTCEVLRVNRAKKEIVVSRRNALLKERDESRRQRLTEVEEGQLRRGVVKNVTDYGAFVDIGGLSGLLHIREMSWGHVRSAADVVKVGQDLEVKVLKVNRDTGKISLGLKQTKANPWDTIEQRFSVGARVAGRVTHLADFGAFVELEEGLEGLVPLSELSWSPRVRNASEVVEPGANVDVVVLSIDMAKRRLTLGIKQTQDNPWADLEQKYPRNATIPGKVTRIVDFGAFVEIGPGVEGLVHISEMADHRVRTPADVVQEGQDVQVRVLGVDADKRRISLSLKPAPTVQERSADDSRARDKKRKRPLRGGLSADWDFSASTLLRK